MRTLRHCAAFVLTLLLVAGVLTPAAQAAAATPWTIPALKQWSPQPGSFTFSRASRVVVTDPVLAATARTFAADLADLAGFPVPVTDSAPRPHDLVLRLDRTITPAAEGYVLSVADTTVISAATDDGVFLGTRSVLQLLHQGLTVPGGTARDWPDYAYRGIVLCNCVTYFSLPALKSLIRDMSYLKYNQLHLEMRVASTVHPENNSTTTPVYSPAEVAELTAFGRQYHVEVSEQTPSPGHMDYFLAAHPELQVKDATGTPDGSVIDMGNPAALPYTDSVIKELLPQFPGTEWYGGGDEVFGDASVYANYPSLVDWVHQRAGTAAPAADAWILWQNEINAELRSNNRTLHVWNDQYYAGMPTKLDPSAVVDYWIAESGRMTPAEIVANGNDIVNVSDSLYYVSAPPSAQWIYETFTPNLFSGNQTIPANDPHLLGAAMGLWPSAHGETAYRQLANLVGPLQALAQKNWGGTPLVPTYAAFQPIITAIGHAPGYLTTGTLPPNTVYTLRAPDGSYATTVGATDASGSVATTAASGAAGQRWLLTEDDTGGYTLMSAADGRCATVAGDSYTENAPISTTDCDGGADQQWLLEPSGHGFVIRSNSSGRSLTAPGNGAGLVQRYGSDTTWTFAPASSQVTVATKVANAGVVPAAGTVPVNAVVTNWGRHAVTGLSVQLTGSATSGRIARLAPGASATVPFTFTAPDQTITDFQHPHATVSYSDGGPVGATSSVMVIESGLRNATAFVANFHQGAVTPITASTGTIGSAIPTGTSDSTIIGNPAGTQVYTANQGANTVSVIDVATKAVAATIPVGNTPAGLALSPDGRTLWVSDYGDNAIQPIDLATGKAGTEIPIGGGTEDLAMSPDGATLWVVAKSDNDVVPYDITTGKPGTPIPVPGGPRGAVSTPDGRTLYVASQSSDIVTPIDTATRTAGPAIVVGSGPFTPAISPDGKTLAVPLSTGSSVVFIDTATNTVRLNVNIGPSPYGVAFSPSGTLAYATAGSDNQVVPIVLPSGETGPAIATDFPRLITIVP